MKSELDVPSITRYITQFLTNRVMVRSRHRKCDAVIAQSYFYLCSSVNLQVEYLSQQWFNLGRVHVKVHADDFVVQPMQLGDLLYQLQKDRSGLATRIDAFQVPP